MIRRVFNQRNYNLLRELVITDFKLRYQGSALGYLWSLAKPMLLFGILYVVFAKFFRFGAGIPHYPTYLLLGIVLWTYFTESTSQGLASIVGRGELIRKVSLPKYIIVLSTSFSTLINLVLNLVVVGVFMAATHVPIYWHVIYLVPIIAELLVLSAAVSFLLAALFVLYRDMSYIWEVVLQMLFYGTPIIYPLSLLPGKYAKIVALSPLAQIIQDARYVTISRATVRTTQILPHPLGIILPPLIILGLLLVAAQYFRISSRKFAENI